MKTRAVSMVLLMIVSALAGCTSGDPDGDGDMGIDTDMLNDLIEDNLQDFINNTSVTVHQEIHYHNNTTVVNNYDETNNEYQNTTNVDGGEVNNFDQSETTYNIGGASFGEGVNGSVSGGSMMFVAHLEFTGMDLFPDYELPENPQENSFSYTYTYYDYLTNSERTDTFNFPCSVFYIVGSQSSNNSSQVSYWEDNDNYYNAWEQMYNSTIADMLTQAAGAAGPTGVDANGDGDYDDPGDTAPNAANVQQLCNDQFTAEMPLADGSGEFSHTFLSIEIPVGYAIQYVQLDSSHSWFGCGSESFSHYSCNGSAYHHEHEISSFYSFSEGPYPYESNFYGGWDNLTIDFDLKLLTYGEWQGYSEPYSYSYYYEGVGSYSVWPTSEYAFTLYYRFVPVIPVE